MAQIRGTAGYTLGNQNLFGGSGRAEATDDPSPLDAIREQTSKIEDWLDTISEPLKPYVLRVMSACSPRPCMVMTAPGMLTTDSVLGHMSSLELVSDLVVF